MANFDPKQPRDDEGKWTDTAAEIAAENEAADARSAKRKELQLSEMEKKRKATEARIAELTKELEDAKASGEDQFVIDRIRTELNREMKRLVAIEETTLDRTVTAARQSAGLTYNKKFISENLFADDIQDNKDGTFTVRKSFYYRMGGDAFQWGERVQNSLPMAEIMNVGEVDLPFKGGAPVRKQSHWWAKIKFPGK